MPYLYSKEAGQAVNVPDNEIEQAKAAGLEDAHLFTSEDGQQVYVPDSEYNQAETSGLKPVTPRQPKVEQKPEERGYVAPIANVLGGMAKSVASTVGEAITSPIETAKKAGTALGEAGEGFLQWAKDKEPPKPSSFVSPEIQKTEAAQQADKEFVQQTPQVSLGEKAEAVYTGALQGIPLTTLLPAYDRALQKAQALGKDGVTEEEILQAYQEINNERSEIIEKAPFLSGVAEVGSSFLPIPGAATVGKGLTKVAAPLGIPAAGVVSKAGKAIQEGGEGFQKSANKAAFDALGATKLQRIKAERVNPELGQFLRDRKIVGDELTGTTMDDIIMKIEDQKAQSVANLDDIYRSVDEFTNGKTVPRKTITDELERYKSNLSTDHTEDATRKVIQDEIDMLNSNRYPDNLDAKTVRNITSKYGKRGFGKDKLPEDEAAQVYGNMSKIYRESIAKSINDIPDVGPELKQMLQTENKNLSNLIAADYMTQGKETPMWSPFEASLLATAHPAGVAMGVTRHVVKTRGPAIAAAFKGKLGAVGEKLGKTLAEALPTYADRVQNTLDTLTPVKASLALRLLEKGVNPEEVLNKIEQGKL